MVEILLKRYPDIIFFYDEPHHPCGGSTFTQYPNFFNIEKLYMKWQRKWGAINHFFNMITLSYKRDLLYKLFLRCLRKQYIASVYIGGSLFQQHVNAPEHDFEKLRYRPLFIIGANFGPYTDEEFYQSYCAFFRECKSVCFRDQKSYSLFSELNNVRWAPDVVFNLPVASQKRHGKRIIISLINPDNRSYMEGCALSYENFLGNFCTVASNKGYTPVLTSFCCNEGDEAEIVRIWERLSPAVQSRTERFAYHTPDNLDALFSGACFVLATRFHAMILALLYELPFFSIAYNEKCTNVLNDLHIKSWCSLDMLSSLDAETVLEMDRRVIDINSCIASAPKQFEDLDRFLNRQKS
ncbi:MAG: polysaccharide pyruvyl transferase family protein [Oscillospiraceae bacterium]|nr:polysaccharide pyruvyl transferase family protein [Oscillospiraceae bacterium]